MGEGTDLAETSPFSEEQVEELRCSIHPAALCTGEPSGKLGPKEASPWVRGMVLPRCGILLHGLLGNFLLENTSLLPWRNYRSDHHTGRAAAHSSSPAASRCSWCTEDFSVLLDSYRLRR